MRFEMFRVVTPEERVGDFYVVGRPGHWFLTRLAGTRVLNEKGQRFWFTKKSAAKVRARELTV
jgi:hypothetical protein